MSKEDRYNQILEILRTRNNVTVNYLAKKLFVSPSTIRRDYQVLQSRGLLHHTYGKATLNFGEALGLPIELRRRNMPAEKLKIGKKAVELVKDGDIIYIDASSTALCMVEHLEKFKISKGISATSERSAQGHFVAYQPHRLRFRASRVSAEHSPRYHQPRSEQDHEGVYPRVFAPHASDSHRQLLRNECAVRLVRN